MKHLYFFLLSLLWVGFMSGQTAMQALVTEKSYDASNQWISQVDFFYNVYGQDSLTIWYTVNQNVLLPSRKRDRIYNSVTGLREQQTDYLWDNNVNNWYPDSRWMFSYDSLNNLVSKLYEVYNSANSVWEADFRSDYTYDTAGNVTLEENWRMNDSLSAWYLDSRISKTYNSDGKLAEEIFEDFDNQLNRLVYIYKLIYSYPAPNLMEYLYQTYDTVNSTWKDTYYVVYTYDQNNTQRLLEVLVQKWDNQQGSFVNNWMDAFNYDNAGVLTSVDGLWYDVTNANWILSMRVLPAYDPGVPGDILVVSEDVDAGWYKDYLFNHQLNEYEEQADVTMTGNLVTQYSKEFFYQSLTVLSQAKETYYTMEIYPNPVSEVLHIDYGTSGGELILFDGGGKIVLRTQENQVDISGLPAGSYFYRLRSGMQIQTGVLLKN